MIDKIMSKAVWFIDAATWPLRTVLDFAYRKKQPAYDESVLVGGVEFRLGIPARELTEDDFADMQKLSDAIAARKTTS